MLDILFMILYQRENFITEFSMCWIYLLQLVYKTRKSLIHKKLWKNLQINQNICICTLTSSTSTAITLAPSRANFWASNRPSPPPAPVMRTTLSCTDFMGSGMIHRKKDTRIAWIVFSSTPSTSKVAPKTPIFEYLLLARSMPFARISQKNKTGFATLSSLLCYMACWSRNNDG